jgi:hypothetical protein
MSTSHKRSFTFCLRSKACLDGKVAPSSAIRRKRAEDTRKYVALWFLWPEAQEKQEAQPDPSKPFVLFVLRENLLRTFMPQVSPGRRSWLGGEFFSATRFLLPSQPPWSGSRES